MKAFFDQLFLDIKMNIEHQFTSKSVGEDIKTLARENT